MSQIVNPPPTQYGFDYFVYIDTDTKIKAKNGRTGTIDFTSTNDVNAVLNSCVLQLQPLITAGAEYGVYDIANQSQTGGKIFVGPGVFPFLTKLLMRSRITLQGSGRNTTVFKRGGGGLTNCPFIESSTWATEAFYNKYRCGDREVQLRDFTIDGNYAGSPDTENSAIKKCGWSWFIDSLNIINNGGHGIFSYCPNLIGPAGAQYPNGTYDTDNAGVSWQDFYSNCFINFNRGFGIYLFGPDESYIRGCQIALNGECAIYNQQYGLANPLTGTANTNPLGRYFDHSPPYTVETGAEAFASAANNWHGQGYHSIIHISDTHTYANNLNHVNWFNLSGFGSNNPADPANADETLNYPEVWFNPVGTASHCTFETSAGPSLRIEYPSYVDNLLTYYHRGPGVYCRASGSSIQFNDYDAGNQSTTQLKYTCGLRVEGNDNMITFRGDSYAETNQVGIQFGTATIQVHRNYIKANIKDAKTGIAWGHGSSANNRVELLIVTSSGQTMLTGSPYFDQNRVDIVGTRAGTDFSFGGYRWMARICYWSK